MMVANGHARRAVDVRTWLEDHGLGQYAEAFASNDVDAEVLRTLTTDDLKELGVTSLGHRKKLLAAIAELDATGEAAPGPSIAPRAPQTLGRTRPALARGSGRRAQAGHGAVRRRQGSLALIEDVDPEDARRILDAALGVMMDAVHRYEGTVNRILVMASWRCSAPRSRTRTMPCAPATRRDPARHACPGRGAARRPRVEVNMPVGLHPGESWCAIGNDLGMDYGRSVRRVHRSEDGWLAVQVRSG